VRCHVLAAVTALSGIPCPITIYVTFYLAVITVDIKSTSVTSCNCNATVHLQSSLLRGNSQLSIFKSTMKLTDDL